MISKDEVQSRVDWMMYEEPQHVVVRGKLGPFDYHFRVPFKKYRGGEDVIAMKRFVNNQIHFKVNRIIEVGLKNNA